MKKKKNGIKYNLQYKKKRIKKIEQIPIKIDSYGILNEKLNINACYVSARKEEKLFW